MSSNLHLIEIIAGHSVPPAGVLARPAALAFGRTNPVQIRQHRTFKPVFICYASRKASCVLHQRTIVWTIQPISWPPNEMTRLSASRPAALGYQSICLANVTTSVPTCETAVAVRMRPGAARSLLKIPFLGRIGSRRLPNFHSASSAHAVSQQPNRHAGAPTGPRVPPSWCARRRRPRGCARRRQETQP